jgi:hypothetical protein
MKNNLNNMANLIWSAVLDDFGAKVRTLDGSQVLLVGLAVAGVLVQHVRSAGLDLRLDDGIPECLSLDLRRKNKGKI